MRFTIITGLSGAGRSTALKTLEDMGFYCVDNIPAALIPEFAKICCAKMNEAKDVAVAADMRMGAFFDDIYEALDALKALPLELDIMFLDASDEVLVSRYKQTRRVHPLSGSGKLLPGIQAERNNLQRLKDMATLVIDTSLFSQRELTSEIRKRFSENHDDRMQITVITFGQKRGIPLDADMVFDMRFIANPFYIPSLRAQTGVDQPVREFVFGFEEARCFLSDITQMVGYIVPCYMRQDKKQLVIAIGCTGGMHRSVAMGEALYENLKQAGFRVGLEHRDLKLERDALKRRFQEQKAEE